MTKPARLPAGKTCGDCVHHRADRCFSINENDIDADSAECNMFYFENGKPNRCGISSTQSLMD